MTLQVRLVHALGDRLIDLPERTFESPLVIGRAATADIQVPMPSVSRRHSLLYCHEGQWYIQDGNGGARTLVNGQPTPEPTAVQSGDVVTLGTDDSPPTIQIDPYGVLAAMQPPAVDAAEGMPQEQPIAPSSAIRYPTPAARVVTLPPVQNMTAPGQLPQPAQFYPPGASAYATPNLPPPVASQESFDAPADEGAAGTDDWLATAAVTDRASQRFYVPKQNTWSAGMISATAFITLAIVAGAAYMYHVRQKAIEAALNAEKAKVVQHNDVVQSKNIFEQAENERRQKALAAIAAAATKPKITGAEMTAAQDPGRQTDEWRRVEEAHTSYKPIEAIVVFSDYMKQFPTTPYAADVRKFMDDALDAIWWEHIVQLAQDRDDAKKEIVAKNRDLAQSQDPEFKKTIGDEKAVFEEKLQNAEDKLKEMNYLSAEKPNLFDAALMSDLRRARNPVYYDRWREGAEKRIRESRGQRPVW
jgi:hypothetical protein